MRRAAPFVREAKVIVASAWTLQQGRRLARDRSRSKKSPTDATAAQTPDIGWINSILVRRLSPNNRKLDFGEKDAGRAASVGARG